MTERACTCTPVAGSHDAVAAAGMGDAAAALACLLELEPLGAESQQALLQGMPFSAARALLLLRMTANALLVRHTELMPTHRSPCALCVRPMYSRHLCTVAPDLAFFEPDADTSLAAVALRCLRKPCKY